MCHHERPLPKLPCPWPKCPEGVPGSHFIHAEHVQSVTWDLAVSFVLETTYRRRQLVISIAGRPTTGAWTWEKVGTSP